MDERVQRVLLDQRNLVHMRHFQEDLSVGRSWQDANQTQDREELEASSSIRDGQGVKTFPEDPPFDLA